MKLPIPRAVYHPNDETRRNQLLEQADARNHKRQQDVEIGAARIIITSPNGTRYALTVANDGTLGTAAV